MNNVKRKFTRIPDSFIQEVSDKTDLTELIGKSIDLKKAGSEAVGVCPFHDDSKPSLTIPPGKHFYKCFACGAKGGAIKWLTDYVGLSFPDAVKELARNLGMEMPEGTQPIVSDKIQLLYEALDRVAAYFSYTLKKDVEAMKYLRDRGLSDDTIDVFRIGYCPAGWDGLKPFFEYPENVKYRQSLITTGILKEARKGNGVYPSMRGRIVFPVLGADKKVHAICGRILPANDTGDGPKYLNSIESPVFKRSNTLFGEAQFHHGLKQPTALVEGFMDVVGAYNKGFKNTLAGLGTCVTEDQLKRLLTRYSKYHGVRFIMDGDKAGDDASEKIAFNLLPLIDQHTTWDLGFTDLGEGYDPDSYIKKHGQEALHAKVNQSIPLSEGLLATFGDTNSTEAESSTAREIKPKLDAMPESLFKLKLQMFFAERLNVPLAYFQSEEKTDN